MDIKTAMEERRSIRGYLNKPVEKDTLEQVLQLATRSISALNAQPWEFAVLTGDIMKKIREDNEACFVNEVEEDIEDPPLDGVYRRRMIDIAKQGRERTFSFS